MRNLTIAFFLTTLFACANNESANHEGNHAQDSGSVATAQDTNPKSIPSATAASVGDAELKINYHAPAVRGRKIWGGLVPYDAVWVTGAHSATSLEVDKDFRLSGKDIPAGKYALFTIPGKDEWTVI